MKIPNISNLTLNTLSGLANNNDSIVPMAIKDAISNFAIVDTYRKEGGADDAKEKVIEEFGTGVVWLFGIPAVKGFMDKFIYPLMNLNPKLDASLLNDKNYIENAKNALNNSSNEALKSEKDLFNQLSSNPDLIKKYKNADFAKFIIPTILSAAALSLIIKHKQKTTQKRIEKDINVKLKANSSSKTPLNNAINENKAFVSFTKKDKNSSVSFKGVKEFFMYNPIANTSLLDGVITSTRLIEARKGEKKEVALKEAFQLVFIYGLAKPIQNAFEFIGKKINAPIELDPKIIFDKNVEEKTAKAVEELKGLDISKTGISDIIHNLNPNSALVEMLDKNNVISTIKDKNGSIQAVSYLKGIDEQKALSTIAHLKSLNNNISNLKGIKAFKLAAIFGNIALAAWAMGKLQPKIAIGLRKLLNNGDNRNPAIVAQEKEMMEKSKLQ